MEPVAHTLTRCGRAAPLPRRAPQCDDRVVARTLTDYWLGFISEGRPSAGAKHGSRLPHWPASANATMRLGLVPTVAHGALRADICAFWDAYHPVPYHSQDERKEASAAFEQR